MNRIVRKFLPAFALCAVAVYTGSGMASGKSNALVGAHEPGTATQSHCLTWHRQDIPNPPPRVGFSLALNSTDQKAYLFGGWDSVNGSILNDLWSTDGTGWTQVQESRIPTEWLGANLVYDGARQEMVLFGGGNFSELFGSTWSYASYEWAQQFPQTSPPPRWGAGMAYDAARNKTVLFGGDNGPEQENWLNDTWTWDGANWQQQLPPTAPYERSRAAMAYDAAHQNIVLFSGGVGGGILDDTWIWDGTTWIEQHPLHSPAGRVDSSMAYDESRQQVILFGGESTDTWAWDGQDWTQLQTFQNPPMWLVNNAQLVYLPSLHTTVLIGDFYDKDCPIDPSCTTQNETQVWALESLTLSYLPLISR